MNAPQIPLALRFPAEQRLDSLRLADAGARALLADVAAGRRGDWLFVAGAAGSGKTHALLGLCAEAERHGRVARYLPLASAAGGLGQALAGADGADLVALDGLDAVLGDRGDEVALFDFHNRLRAAGGSAVYAARQPPAALPVDLPDLRSRLGQCTLLPLSVPDEATRREILRERATRRGLELDDAVLDWLFARVGRNLGTLTALLDRIDRESLAAKRRVTVPFVRGLLGS